MSTWSTWWLIVDTGDCAESASCVTGLVRNSLDEHVDRAVERRREEQALAVAGRLLHDPAHAGEEAEVGHVVGLVEDRDLDAVEDDVALLHEVLEAAGAGDDDVDAAPEALDLRVLADAAEDRLRVEAERLGERRHRGVDLRGELAGRGEDEGARAAGQAAPARLRQARQERQQEGVRLARAGAATAEHVATGERVGQRRRLDRGRGGDAEAVEDRDEVGGHAEKGEVRVSGHRWILQKVDAVVLPGAKGLSCEVSRRKSESTGPARVRQAKKKRPEAELGGPLGMKRLPERAPKTLTGPIWHGIRDGGDRATGHGGVPDAPLTVRQHPWAPAPKGGRIGHISGRTVAPAKE